MKKLICIVFFIVLAGCAPELSAVDTTGSVETAEPTPQGWFSPQKTEPQRSQDLSECRARCAHA